MILRLYQQSAVDAVYQHLRTRDDNPCVVIPTGGGKTPVMATLCRDAVGRWEGRVLILAHVKELLEQTAATLNRMASDIDVGVYSAGLRRRDTSHPVIVAGIQSVYKRACDLDAFDLVIVDEAHLLPPDGEGMYQSFLTDARTINPNIRLIGLTATPYRLKSGMLCAPDHLLNHVCYEMGVKELITAGYLCPLKTKAGRTKADCGGLHIRAGEFVGSEVEELMDTDELVHAACREVIAMTGDRRSVLIFAASVAHAEHVQQRLQELTGDECGLITGGTPAAERDRTIARFKRQQVATDLFGNSEPPLKYLVNVNVLTTGFDAPNVDCVVLLRPTASPGLYYQMVGRGFRLHPDKHDCLVLDFGGNIIRHGPVDAIQITERPASGGDAPAKECPDCQAVIHAAYAVCPDCGFEFPSPERNKHETRASSEGILSGEITDEQFEVQDVSYSVHIKRDASADTPKTMRVDYRLGLNHWQSEWVCFEHSGYARQKAIAWWKQRSPDPVPESAQRAVEIAEAGGVALAEEITVRSVSGEKYDRIIAYKLGAMPEPVPACDQDEYDTDEIPF